MTDEPDLDPHLDPDVDPEQDTARIRALLAGARFDGDLPPAVGARLDGVLTELVRERDRGQDEGAAVVPLVRRTRVRLLTAAAVVLIVGLGGVGLNRLLTEQGPAPASTAAGAPLGASPTAGPERAPLKAADLTAALPRLSTAHFAADAARLARTHAGLIFGTESLALPLNGQVSVPPSGLPAPPAPTQIAPGAGASTGASTGSAAGSAGSPTTSGPDTVDQLSSKTAPAPAPGVTTAACPGPVVPDASEVPILLDDRPAVLVIYPVAAGHRRLEAWSCDGSTRLAAASIPG